MNAVDAEAIALKQLENQLKLHYCIGKKIPTKFYNFNADEYHIFMIEDPNSLRVGGDRYVAVNKVDGSIRDLGFNGV